MSLLNGLAEAGRSIATTAGAMSLEAMRSDLEEQRTRLAAELAEGASTRARADTQAFTRSEREADQAFRGPKQEAEAEVHKQQVVASKSSVALAEEAARRKNAAGDAFVGLMTGNNSGGGSSGSYEKAITGVESRGGKMIPNELGSGAYGPYQFMPGTWSDVRTKNPELNLPEDMKQATPEQHKAAFDKFTAGNATALQKAGVEPTPANLYLAHRFGAAGAEKVAKADDNAPLATVLPGDWQNQNPDMRGQTVGGFKRLAEERMKGVTMGSASSSVVPGGGAQPSAIMQLAPDVRAAIGVIGQGDYEAGAKLLLGALDKQKKEDAWVPLDGEVAKKVLGTAYDPQKAYQINRVGGKIEPIGGSMVSINNQAESEALKTQIQSANKTNLELQENSIKARNGLAQVNRLDNLLDEMNTGKFTESTQNIKQIAKSIGIDLEGMGIKDDTAQAQAASALSKQLALALRDPSQGGGMPGAMSDADRQYLTKMTPSMENTPEGRKLMIEYAKRMYQRSIDTAKIANEYSRTPSFRTDPNGLYAKLQEFADANPLFTKEDRGGATEPESDISGVAIKGGPPGPAQTVRITGDDDFRSLKSGTLFVDPEGRMRRKP